MLVGGVVRTVLGVQHSEVPCPGCQHSHHRVSYQSWLSYPLIAMLGGAARVVDLIEHTGLWIHPWVGEPRLREDQVTLLEHLQGSPALPAGRLNDVTATYHDGCGHTLINAANHVWTVEGGSVAIDTILVTTSPDLPAVLTLHDISPCVVVNGTLTVQWHDYGIVALS